jgi:hypothetical protein
MTARAVHSEPTPGQHIREIHCWIATYPDGSEGIMGYGTAETGLMPLMSSRRDLAEQVEPLAQRAAEATRRDTGHRVTYRLVSFTSTEGTRQ